VYRAVHNKTKQEVAIKVIQVDKFRDIPKLEEGIVNEINILSQINRDCEFIVKYLDMLKTTNNFYFIYEFCNGGTLEKLLQKDGPLQERRALVYARQLLEAFKTLSRNNIMHRDLKPDNILLHNGNIKLADFGFCKPLESKNDLAQTMLGSPIYMAPEVLKG
jgi:serine/threonine protein kinase